MDETIKNAIKYISEILKETPDIDKLKLIDETSKRFDLNPMQTEFLTNKLVNEK
jgi:hypothetical protein